jgi:DNA (cytosine-5)-methyltransferase 1
MIAVGSLFAGIGGLELGLERTGGFRAAWQVEIDPFCRRVLARHWPDVRRWDDVRTFPPEPLEEWHCDLICGGFPCQDVSLAGRRAGIDGRHSGLWSEFARVVRVLRPRHVLVENVPGLLVRGLDRVLGDLAALGFDAEWECIPAASVGAPHIRDRVFILAHSQRCGFLGADLHLGEHVEEGRKGSSPEDVRLSGEAGGKSGLLAHSVGTGLAFRPCLGRDARQELQAAQRDHRADGKGIWSSEPDVGRVAHGIPDRVDRLRALGNAVVPQVAEYIGRLILRRYRSLTETPA